jgi:hypothetical protein
VKVFQLIWKGQHIYWKFKIEACCWSTTCCCSI